MSPAALSTQVFEVKVRPNARTSSLECAPGGKWVAQIKAPPVDGKANQELIALVARHFGCTKAAVTIKRGAGGRVKVVQVALDRLP